MGSLGAALGGRRLGFRGEPLLGMLQGAGRRAAPLHAARRRRERGAHQGGARGDRSRRRSRAAPPVTSADLNAVDVDPTDDKLSAAEVAALADAASPVLAAVADLVHAAFPLRRSADDLKGLLKGLLLGTSGGGSKEEELARSGIAFVDGNGDGFVDRKEAGKAFSAAKKSFLEVAKTVQQMGPMMAMFGGGGGGMGGMGEF